MSADILNKINSSMSEFSKGQKAIARYINENYDKAAFMTAGKLGKVVNVSESTVVRFAAQLGFDGYPGMQKALQEMIRNKLTSVQRIDVANTIIGNNDILSRVLHSNIEEIRLTLESVDKEAFENAVNTILHAKNIYIMGVRSSAALAGFLGFYLNLFFDNVIILQYGMFGEMFEQLVRLGPDDVVIGISFPRYSSRAVQVMEYSKARSAKVIAITDSMASPVAANADHTLIASSTMVSFVDSLVGPLSLVNALIVALSRKKEGELSGTFDNLEKIWAKYEVYEKGSY